MATTTADAAFQVRNLPPWISFVPSLWDVVCGPAVLGGPLQQVSGEGTVGQALLSAGPGCCRHGGIYLRRSPSAIRWAVVWMH